MTLQKQEIPINFTEGVDTKTDDKLAAKMSVLENAYIGQNSTINKINGFNELNDDILNPATYGLSTSITKGETLFTNKDILGLINSDQVLVYSDQNTEKWYAPNAQAMNLETQVAAVDFPQVSGQCIGIQAAEGPNDIVIVGNYKNLSSRYDAVFIRKNKNDGTIIYETISTSRSEFSDGLKVAEVGGSVYLFAKEGNGVTSTIFFADVTQYNANINLLPLIVNPSADTRRPYEVFVENNFLFIVYVNTAGKLVVNRYDSSLTLQGSYTHTAEARAINSGYSLTWSSTLNAYGVFYYTYESPNFYHNAFKLSPAMAISGTVTSSNQGVNIDTLVMYHVTSSVMQNGDIRASFESKGSTQAYSLVSSVYDGTTLTTTGTSYASWLAARSFVLNGKVLTPVRRSNGIASSVGVTIDALTDVSYLLDENNNYVAQLSLDTLSLAISSLGIYSGGVGLPLAVSQYGSSIVNLRTSSFEGSASSEINDSALVACGGVFAFDGATYSECGFIAPPVVFGITSGTGSGAVPAGTYTYAVTYSYVDLSGNVYESAPAFTGSITTASTGFVSVRVMPVQSRRSTSVNFVKLYRRDTDGIYKLVNSVDFATLSLSILDLQSNISRFPTLYTTGGVLENDPPPSANIFTTHADRVFCVNEERPIEVYFSKKTQRGSGIHFSSFLFFTVADNKNKTYERVTGLGSLDDKFIILKNQSLFAVFGDGPNELGVGSFSEPKLISADVGCRDARSVVSTAEGLMFMSSKGIYLLTRSLETVYIGAEVERFNNEEITSAILLPSKNQVQFTTRSGVRLTYSYFYRQWSWSLNREAQSAVTWKNKETHLKSNGLVRVENNTFLDINIPITQKIGTSWIKLNGIQNFQRIYRIMMLGNFKSPHKVSVKIYYDFEGYVWETVTVTPMASGYNATTRPTNEEIYNGGNDGIYQYEIQLSRQKCQALKIEISDFDQAGESFSLTGMSMIVGLKKGMNKITSSKKF